MSLDYLDAIARANPALSHWEANQLLLALASGDVRHVLEIGTHRGGSARLWRDALSPDLVVTVDSGDGGVWEGDASGIKRVTGRRSQDPLTQELVRGILAGRRVDFLFIDGEHAHASVSADYRAYAPLVRRGGLIALHDVCAYDAPDCGVALFWKSLEIDPSLITSVAHEEGRTGIGMVWVE